jgi:hypothetical protein
LSLRVVGLSRAGGLSAKGAGKRLEGTPCGRKRILEGGREGVRKARADGLRGGDLRASLPTVVHGSTGDKNGKAPVGRVRRVLNSWFVGIEDDHETLEIAEDGPWSLLSRHQDLLPVMRTPSGNINTHAPPKTRFPRRSSSVALGQSATP